TINVNPLPVTSAISGSSTVCANQVGVTCSVTLTSGSSYAWTVPTGATITAGGAGPNNNSITVTFGVTSGTVRVTETSAAGCVGSLRTLSVTVRAYSASPVVNSPICSGATSVRGTSSEAN